MSLKELSDEHFMKLAIKEAEIALSKDEVPVGAVIVSNNTIIARGHNLSEQLLDVTAHAEMQSITAAANHLGVKYLDKCTLYVTLEPCVMCAGALYWSQIGKIVYGATDEKKGAGTIGKNLYHPKTTVVGGIMADECGKMLTDFFRTKRQKKDE
jgi:tRNA(adenine34) deaminase